MQAQIYSGLQEFFTMIKFSASHNRKEKKDLVESLIEINRNAAIRFFELAKKSRDSAEKYYKSLGIDVQEYVMYSPISQNYYNSLIVGTDKNNGDRNEH